jgi:hypothetical protein
VLTLAGGDDSARKARKTFCEEGGWVGSTAPGLARAFQPLAVRPSSARAVPVEPLKASYWALQSSGAGETASRLEKNAREPSDRHATKLIQVHTRRKDAAAVPTSSPVPLWQAVYPLQ